MITTGLFTSKTDMWATPQDVFGLIDEGLAISMHDVEQIIK